ncbi:MATE family efflux transporter [Clostridium paraputrificum]|uniref:MATE family efflux transporter n=1 Tax=Clostridium TaxID=1485 RepID=UPI003D3472CC
MKSIDLLKDDIKKLYLHYLFPTLGASLVTSVYVLFDTIFVGQGLGGDGLAALNINIPIFSFVFGIGLLIGVGGSTLMSMAKGEGNNKKGNAIFSLSMVLAVTLAIIFTVIGVVFEEKIAYLLGATSENIDMVREYTYWIVRGSGFFLIGNSLQGFLRCDKAPKLAMIAVGVGAVTNIILDYLFIFPLNMGMAGAALATVTAQVLSVIVLLTHFISKKNNLKFAWMKIRFKNILNIVKCGLPSFCIELSVGIVILLFNLKLQDISGLVAVSVYGVISNIAIVVSALFNGIGQTIQPIVSYNVGANNYDRAKIARKIGIITALIIGIGAWIISITAPSLLINIFTKATDDMISIGSEGLRIYSFTFIIAGVNMVNGAYYQAMGLAKESLTIGLGRGLIFIIILLYPLSSILGVRGIWLTVPMTELLTLVIIYLIIKPRIERIKI